MAKIENYKYTIEEAFKACSYIVPDYQREYVWQDTQVQLLLDDIDEQVGSDSEYFIGTVLVAPVEDERSQYEVIDGQQRLTTFFLMLCALRNHLKGENQHKTIGEILSTSFTTPLGETEARLKLDPRYENASELVKLIEATDGTPEETQIALTNAKLPKFGSLENLLNAYSLLHRALVEKYSSLEELKRFWGYLANNVVFIQISADVGAALKIFETINERGVGLNPMDLLKNLLFTKVSQKEFSRLKDDWKKITAPLEKRKEKPLRFLRYYIMANYEFETTRGDAVVREDEIYDWFTNKNNAALCGYAEEPFAFIRGIIKNVELYLDFREGKDNEGNKSSAMEDLRKMAGGAFSLHYVLLLAASPLPAPLFNHFVRQLESFLFYYIFTKTTTKQLEKDFSLWADELRGICSLATEDEQKQKLNDFVNDKFDKEMKDLSAPLEDAFARYHLNSMQKYRTNYLLAKITWFVESSFQGVERSLTDFTQLEIEHILPNTPSTELLVSFTQENPEVDYHEVKNKLGNLTMLEKPHNIVAGNDFYEKKKELYKLSGNYLTKSLAGLAEIGRNTSVSRINDLLSPYEQWSVESIQKRQIQLLNLSKEIWKLHNL